MAPNIYPSNTDVYFHGYATCSCCNTTTDFVITYTCGCLSRQKDESKQEKLDRVSLQKMYASWSVYNEKPDNIIVMKQVSKPQHLKRMPYAS